MLVFHLKWCSGTNRIILNDMLLLITQKPVSKDLFYIKNYWAKRLFFINEQHIYILLDERKKITRMLEKDVCFTKITVFTYFELSFILSNTSSDICAASDFPTISSNSILPTNAFTSGSFPYLHKQTAILPKLLTTAHINNSLYGSTTKSAPFNLNDRIYFSKIAIILKAISLWKYKENKLWNNKNKLEIIQT